MASTGLLVFALFPENPSLFGIHTCICCLVCVPLNTQKLDGKPQHQPYISLKKNIWNPEYHEYQKNTEP